MIKRFLTKHCGFGNPIIPILSIFVILGIAFGIQNPLSATTGGSVAPGGEQPNINASTMFETHSMVLGNNIKNLVVLIPNEAHESTNQPKNQYPFINQPYLPQNAVVNVGTGVTWFNGDVDHDHKITLSGNSNTAELGDFAFNVGSKAVTFNETGTFNYIETDVNNDDPNFVMNGTINVIDQVNSLSSTNATASAPAAPGAVNPDTVGTYMIPAKDLNQYISTLTSKGFNIDSTHTFTDLRGGQKGTGPEQTLIAWTTSGMNIDQVISALEEITPSLPYS
jgi:plastocyanin